jgi:hypothetical protein
MKNVSIFVLAAIIGIAFIAPVFAQAPAGTTETKETTTTTTTTSPEKKATTTTTITKSKSMKFYGKVISMDTAAKMMTVKGKKGDITFDVSNAEMKIEVIAGDKVMVNYMKKEGKMTASLVKKIENKKLKTKTTTTTTTEEKTEQTTAPAK